MATPFISSTDLADYRKQVVDNDLAAIAIDSACQIVRDELGQGVDRVTGDIVDLDSDGTDTLLLPEGPVESVSAVVLNSTGTPLTPGTDVLLDKERDALVMKSKGRKFLKGRQLYKVTYTHGIATVPSSVRLVALNLAARVYDQQLVQQESVGGYQAVYAASDPIGLTEAEKSVLHRAAGMGRRTGGYSK